MTTIVCFDGEMVSDTAVSHHEIPLSEPSVPKLFVCAEHHRVVGVAGACGWGPYIIEELADFESGGLNGVFIQLPSSDAEWEALVMEKDGSVWYLSKQNPAHPAGNWPAIGSGSDFAKAGLIAGLDAEGAVRCAAVLDTGTLIPTKKISVKELVALEAASASTVRH